MKKAGGADYTQDPGLYAYLKEYQFNMYYGLAKSRGENDKMISYQQKITYYQKLKSYVLPSVIKLYMNSKYQDFCKCSGFKGWFEKYSKMSESYLWQNFRMIKSNVLKFPKKYFGRMDSICGKKSKRNVLFEDTYDYILDDDYEF